jgi:hypothetical protein
MPVFDTSSDTLIVVRPERIHRVVVVVPVRHRLHMRPIISVRTT